MFVCWRVWANEKYHSGWETPRNLRAMGPWVLFFGGQRHGSGGSQLWICHRLAGLICLQGWPKQSRHSLGWLSSANLYQIKRPETWKNTKFFFRGRIRRIGAWVWTSKAKGATAHGASLRENHWDDSSGNLWETLFYHVLSPEYVCRFSMIFPGSKPTIQQNGTR